MLAFGKMRESFDIVTARAVSAMPVLIELAAPFVKVGGIFAAMKGNSDDEVAAGKAKLKNMDSGEETEVSLPQGLVSAVYDAAITATIGNIEESVKNLKI